MFGDVIQKSQGFRIAMAAILMAGLNLSSQPGLSALAQDNFRTESLSGSSLDAVVEYRPIFVTDIITYVALGDKLYFFGRFSDSEVGETQPKLISFDGQNYKSEQEFTFRDNSFPICLTAFNNKLYFVANARLQDSDPFLGLELWKFDPSISVGSSGRIGMVENLAGDENGFSYGCSTRSRAFTEFQGKLFFAANSGSGEELHSLDSTGSISQVFDIRPNTMLSSSPGEWAVFQDKLYFAAYDGEAKLWSYDGDSNPVKINTGEVSNPFHPVVLGSKLFFGAHIPETGYELFSFDGSATRLEADVIPGPSDSYLYDLTVFQDKIYFTAEYIAEDGYLDAEPFVFDGTFAQRLVEIFQPIQSAAGDYEHGSWPSEFTAIGDFLYFIAEDGNNDEPWVYDGVNLPRKLTSFSSSNGESSPSLYFTGPVYNSFLQFEDAVYFSATSSNSPSESKRLFAFVPPTSIAQVPESTNTSYSPVTVIRPIQEVIKTEPADLPLGLSTKLNTQTGQTAKIHIFNPIGKGKIQIFINGREVMWSNSRSQADYSGRKPRVDPKGQFYLPHTIRLQAGPNRIQVHIQGEPQLFSNGRTTVVYSSD